MGCLVLCFMSLCICLRQSGWSSCMLIGMRELPLHVLLLDSLGYCKGKGCVCCTPVHHTTNLSNRQHFENLSLTAWSKSVMGKLCCLHLGTCPLSHAIAHLKHHSHIRILQCIQRHSLKALHNDAGASRQGELLDDQAGQDCGHDLHPCCPEEAGVPAAGAQIRQPAHGRERSDSGD